MSWLRSLGERLAALFGKRRLDAEMEKELRFHLERETEKNVRSGMSPAEARRRAMVAFGGVERFKERTREARGVTPVEDLLRDLRLAGRSLRKNPGFAAVAVFSLALGIGANTVVFSLANGMLFRDTALADPETLVNVYRDVPGFSAAPQAYPDLEELEDATSEVFDGVAAAAQTFAQVELGGGVETLLAELVTGTYFPLHGLRAAVGRTLRPSDDVAPGRHFVAMLGYGFWQRAFGGDPSVVGTTLRVNGLAFEIVGVVQEEYPGYFKGFAPDLFAPLAMLNQFQPGQGDRLEDRGSMVWTRARLRAGVTLEQAEVALAGLAADFRRAKPSAWEDTDSFRLVPQSQVILNPMFDRIIFPALILSFVVVGLVLLIATANLASVLLARAVDRRKDIALRLALGASRGSIARQVLTEAMVLAFLGGAAGVALAVWGTRAARAVSTPYPAQVTLDTGLDLRVLAFTAAVSVAAGLFFGLLPALQATRPRVAQALQDGSGGTSPRILARQVLVGGQVAVSLAILVTAGLFLRSLGATQHVAPGFGREPAAVLSIFLPADRYSAEEGRVFLREYMDRALATPGVQAVGLTGNLPLTTYRYQFGSFIADGVEPPPGQSGFQADRSEVDAGFFDAAGISLVAGRNFDAGDREDGQRVVIVNEALAVLFWPGREPVGRVIREVDGNELQVVGVTRTTKVRTLGEPPRPFVYYPHSQEYSSYVSVVARTAGDAEALTRDLVALLRQMDRDILVFEQKTLERHVAVMLIPARLSALLSSLFGILALALALVGLYGVVSYSVSRRAREMGIRLCMGAAARSVVSLLVREGMGVVLAGAAVGLILAYLGSWGLAGLLFQVRPGDPVAFVVAPGIFLGVAFLAAWLPARRASRVNPVTLLKAE